MDNFLFYYCIAGSTSCFIFILWAFVSVLEDFFVPLYLDGFLVLFGFFSSWSGLRSGMRMIVLTPFEFSAEVCSLCVGAHVSLIGLCYCTGSFTVFLLCVREDSSEATIGPPFVSLACVDISFLWGVGCLRFDSLCGCWRWIHKLGAYLFFYSVLAPET